MVATALTTVTTVLPATTAHAAEPVAGPIDPNTGYPFWYDDGTGTKFELCLDRPDTPAGLCLAAPQNPAARPWVDQDPALSNLAADPETFWFNAEAEIRDDTRRLRFVAAQEATFGGADGAPRAGDQIAFGRVRVRLNGMVPGASYTVTQPYGTETYVADEEGQVFETEDIGCLDLPCDFTKPNASSLTSYLRWDPAVGPAAPAGYVGDPNVPHQILAGPSGNDFFEVVGPNAGGPGVDVARTDLFNVQGKVWNPTQPMLGLLSTHNQVDFGTVDLGAAAPAAQTVTLTNAGGGATPLQLETLRVNGAGSDQFALANDTCSNASLAPGATCTVDVSYTPAATAGPVTAQLDVPSLNGKDSEGGQRVLLHARVSDGTGKDARVTGPISAENGFPEWYQDETGTRVALCDDQADPLCVLPDVPEGFYDPAEPMSFPTNFPSELFWWNADAGFDTGNSQTGGAVSARLVLAEEAAFVSEEPVDGDQVAFGRIRVRVDGLVIGGTYAVTTPYGDYTFVAEDDGSGVGVINYTEDIGCAETPCDFDRVNQSNVGPFLRQVGAPEGYLGDPNVTAPVTGGPNGNVFAISGPGVNDQTDLFAVSGKELAGPGGGTSDSQLTASATTAEVTSTQPASVTLTNAGTAPATPQVSLPDGSGFTVADDCPASLVPGGSCTVTVGLDATAPALPGTTATLQVSDGGTPALTLTLVAAPYSRLTASKTTVQVRPGKPGKVRLTNRGGASATPRLALVPATDSGFTASGCGGTLAAGASCTVTVGLDALRPAQPGDTAVLRVTDSSDATRPAVRVTLQRPRTGKKR